MPDAIEPHTVFVSHAHTDNDLCDRYVAALRARGLDVWYDRTNMQDGHFLSQDIEVELRSRTALVLLVTPASLASYWVRLEVGAFQSLAAQDPTRLMLPVRIAECEMPLLMMGIKWIDAASLGFDATIDALAKALHGPDAPPAHAQATGASVEELIERGRMLDRVKRHDYALAAFDKALSLDSASSAAWAGRGYALVGLKRYDEALDAFDQALLLDPGKSWTWFGKYSALNWLGRTAEAGAALKRARELGWKD